MWLDYIKTNSVDLCQPEPEAVVEQVEPVPEPVEEKKNQIIRPLKLIFRDGKRFLVKIDPENSVSKPKRIKTEDDSVSFQPEKPANNYILRVNPKENDCDSVASDGERPVVNIISRIKKEDDSDSNVIKVEQPLVHKIRRIKAEDGSDYLTPKIEHSLKVRHVDNKSDIIRFSPKTVKKLDTESRRDVDKVRSDKKDYSRSNLKTVKSSHSKLKESELRKDKIRELSRLKSKPNKEKEAESRGKSKDNQKRSDITEDGIIRPTPAISSLGKIPKKTAPTATMSAAEATATGGVLGGGAKEPTPLPVIKKGTFSDERKRTAEIKPSDRPKTVKTLPTKFRSTGLEEEVKPPSRKKEPVKDLVKRPSPLSPKEVSSPPEKKIKVPEIKEKTEKPGIKLIPPKPKSKYFNLISYLKIGFFMFPW